MTQRMLASGLLMLALSAGVYGEDKSEKPKTTPAHAGLERMKKLAGTWVEVGKDGKTTDKVVSVVKVIGGGGVVHETLFPGQPHEMVSVYYVEKGDLVMTHYCVLGNQPRMKADPKSPGNKLRFEFAGGTNLDPSKDKHMHEGTITFVDDDHIEWSGVCWENGKPCEGANCGMKLARKK